MARYVSLTSLNHCPFVATHGALEAVCLVQHRSNKSLAEGNCAVANEAARDARQMRDKAEHRAAQAEAQVCSRRRRREQCCLSAVSHIPCLLSKCSCNTLQVHLWRALDCHRTCAATPAQQHQCSATCPANAKCCLTRLATLVDAAATRNDRKWMLSILPLRALESAALATALHVSQ